MAVFSLDGMEMVRDRVTNQDMVVMITRVSKAVDPAQRVLLTGEGRLAQLNPARALPVCPQVTAAVIDGAAGMEAAHAIISTLTNCRSNSTVSSGRISAFAHCTAADRPLAWTCDMRARHTPFT